MKDSDTSNGEIIGALLAGGAAFLTLFLLGHGLTLRSTKTVVLATVVGGFIGKLICSWIVPVKANEPSIDEAAKG